MKIKEGNTSIISAPRDPPRKLMISATPGTAREMHAPRIRMTTPALILIFSMALGTIAFFTTLQNELAIGLTLIRRPKKTASESKHRHTVIRGSVEG